MKVDPIVSEGAARASNKSHCVSVTRETPLHDGGSVATRLMTECTYEVEAMSQLIIDLIDAERANGFATDDFTLAIQVRSIAATINARNGLFMSYFSANGETVAGAAQALGIKVDFVEALDHV